MKKLKTLFTSSVLAVVVSLLSSTEGDMNMCTTLRVFAVTNSTNATLLTFTDTLTNQISTTSFENEFLPTSEVCGRGYIRCNLLLTSSSDGTIIVAMFPLQTGIGLVSYDAINDTLVFREKFILTQTLQHCTFMYFIETRGIQGYCLGPPSDEISLYTLEITITYGDLSSSSVQDSRFDEDFTVYNLDTLSNFILYSGTMCFLSNEGNHVVFLESGYFIDQSFGDLEFIEIPTNGACSGVSRLQRVGSSCQIATQCDGPIAVFDINNGEFPQKPEFESGQFFVCPDQLFVEFINDTLALYSRTGSERQFVNDTNFPFEHISQGACTVVKEQLVLILTLDDGRTFLIDFVQSSYRQLGESNHSAIVPSEVNGQIVAVNNGSETLIYNLPCLSCCQQPIAVVPNNFVLIDYISMSHTDTQCLCSVSPSPSTSATVIPPTSLTGPSSFDRVPIDVSVPSNYSVEVATYPTTSPIIIVSESLPPSLSPSPTASPRNETSSISPAVVAVSVVAPIAFVILALSLILFIFLWRRRYKKEDVCANGSSTSVKSKIEEIPLKGLDEDGINKVTNDSESTASNCSQTESLVESSEHSNEVKKNVLNNGEGNDHHPLGDVVDLTKRRENLANNHDSYSKPLNVDVEPEVHIEVDGSSYACASVIIPEQEVNRSYVSSEESFVEESGGCSRSSRENLLAPRLVNSLQERGFDRNQSHLLLSNHFPVQREHPSAPVPSTITNHSGSASNFDNSTNTDSSEAVAPHSETTTTNGGAGVMLYQPPSTFPPHPDIVGNACQQRNERQNHDQFNDYVNRIQGNTIRSPQLGDDSESGEPNNDLHFSSSRT